MVDLNKSSNSTTSIGHSLNGVIWGKLKEHKFYVVWVPAANHFKLTQTRGFCVQYFHNFDPDAVQVAEHDITKLNFSTWAHSINKGGWVTWTNFESRSQLRINLRMLRRVPKGR